MSASRESAAARSHALTGSAPSTSPLVTVADVCDGLAPNQVRHPELFAHEMVDQDPDRPFRTRGWAVPLVVAYLVHGMVELGHRALMGIQRFHALTAPLVADGGNAARLTAPRRCRRMPQ